MTGSRPASGFGPAREVALVFLRLGVVAFGGPAAHTAMMRQELVQRRSWVTDERFVDLMGATNLIPGPNSTELAIHLGHERAGWRGLLLAGVMFILPAAVIVTVLAWAYVEYGDTPTFDHVLYGVVPVVVAIIAWALVPLARAVVKSLWLAVLLARRPRGVPAGRQRARPAVRGSRDRRWWRTLAGRWPGRAGRRSCWRRCRSSRTRPPVSWPPCS